MNAALVGAAFMHHDDKGHSYSVHSTLKHDAALERLTAPLGPPYCAGEGVVGEYVTWVPGIKLRKKEFKLSVTPAFL